MRETDTSHPVLLYDGVCGFCNKSVRFVLRHDKRKKLSFASLQSGYGRSVLTRHPELYAVDSLVFVERGHNSIHERVFVRSDAALRVAAYLGGPWKLAAAAYLIPRFVRDYFYDQFARRRYQWFGRYDRCLLPPPEARDRFLDAGGDSAGS